MSALDLSDNITRAHHDSMVRAMRREGQMPNTLEGRIAWLIEHLDAAPTALHLEDVEPDSALGSPKLTDQFRRYIDGAASDLVSPTRYARPLAAALERMTYKGKPLLARWCLEVGRAQGDWRAVAGRRKSPVEECEAIVFYALGCLWWEFYDPVMHR